MAKPNKAKFNKPKEISFLINEEIENYPLVRVIGDGVDSKVLTMTAARKKAEELGLDLILVNAQSQPPIVRIANYEKMLYEMKKKEKANKKNETKLKIVQLRTNIAQHDLDTKVSQAKDFINHGDKVKVVLTMRGRELGRREVSKKSLLEFIVKMEDVAIMESPIREEGNRSSVILKKK